MKIIDMSHDLHNDMWSFPRPWYPDVAITQMGFFSQVGRNTHSITISSHQGTHIDAPYHQIADGVTIERVGLDVLIGQARIVDLSFVQPGTEITGIMLEQMVGSEWPKRLILNFGWAKFWDSEAFFQNCPYLSEDAAQCMVRHGVRLVGMDTTSPDNHGPDATKDTPVHRILLGEGIILVENLCNLEVIGGNTFTFYALPLRLRGVDGSPARCIGIID